MPKQPLFTEILKEVSRSFYLSMRILPGEVRLPISLAYLLARAADSIADLDLVDFERRETLLDHFTNCLSGNSSTEVFYNAIENTGFEYDSINKAEATLLSKMPEIFQIYSELPARDKQLVGDVVSTLVEGMRWDLQYFHQTPPKLTAFTTESQLDRYTYLVAGCVGEFWTNSLFNHLPQLGVINAQQMTDWGVNLGKGLQLVNILRDLPRDLRNDRCYLPSSALSELNLSAQDLLNKNSQDKLKPLLQKLTLKADNYFEDGLRYIMQLPANEHRLRLSALWPLLIGLDTLHALWQHDCWLDPDTTIKLPRSRIYKLIAYSLIGVRFNTRLENWVLKKSNNLKSTMASR